MEAARVELLIGSLSKKDWLKGTYDKVKGNDVNVDVGIKFESDADDNFSIDDDAKKEPLILDAVEGIVVCTDAADVLSDVSGDTPDTAAVTAFTAIDTEKGLANFFEMSIKGFDRGFSPNGKDAKYAGSDGRII